MRRRAGAAVVAAMLAVGLASACTSKAVTSDGPTPSVSVSAPGAIPIPTATGPHHYTPGSATLGDSLFPAEGNGGYDATHYAITISYDPATKVLRGGDVVTATATQDLSRFDLDLHGLTVGAVTVNGAAAAYTRVADKLQITPAHGIDVGTAFTTHVSYSGAPTDYHDPLLGEEGFVASGPGALAQGEPDVAASWYAVNDHPRDKATYDITITAPSSLSALSNGILAGKTSVGGATTWHWTEDKPMASYLAMVAIGKYRVVNSTHDGMPVVLAVDATLPTTVDAQLAHTPQIVDFLATQFGPYPFDAMGGIVHNDNRFNFALENQTRPVYASIFFKAPGDQGTTVIAHELAHQWYGDSVSVANWKDVWLNEGFATYAEWLWTQHEGGKTPKASFDEIYNGRGLADEGAAQPTVRTLFGEEVYIRGAATLEALRITVGDTKFFQIIRTWAAQRAYGNGDTAQFIALANQISGKSLDAFFKPWLFSSDKPPYPKPLS
jgi:aminopeptidase N